MRACWREGTADDETLSHTRCGETQTPVYLSHHGPFNYWRPDGMVDQDQECAASDRSDSLLSYSSSSSSLASSAGSSCRNYLDPWDVENAMYVRGKRISFASDPGTFSSATAAVECEPEVPKQQGRCCGCEPLYNSAAASLLTPKTQRYLSTFCTMCDAADERTDAFDRTKQAANISPPTSITYKVPASAASEYTVHTLLISPFLIFDQKSSIVFLIGLYKCVIN
jgi:hypothetical protein